MCFKIRLLDPWAPEQGRRLVVGEFDFWTEWSPERADGLLSKWRPDPELLEFSGPKVWYCCEPRSTSKLYGSEQWQGVIRHLRPDQMLHHQHPDSQYRVPHITHWGEIGVDGRSDRKEKAVAVASNFGGPPRKRWKAMRRRVAFATHGLVDLYGRRESWEKFRRHLWSWRGLPNNYVGEIPGGWGVEEKLNRMAEYKVAVCLENTCEPNYFTEKFVDAVRAGCIPVYHPHPTVREGVLRGARWVGPEDYGWNVESTLRAALDGEIDAYRSGNEEWLRGDAVRATSAREVYRRIGKVLVGSGER
jgi:hypothetical protein